MSFSDETSDRITVCRHGSSMMRISRQGSAVNAVVIKDDASGTIRVERKGSDLMTAVSRRNSSAALPSVQNLVASSKSQAEEPNLSPLADKHGTIAKAASHRGEYTEHLLSLDALQESFGTRFDVEDLESKT